jgi:hypothetical protein
MAADALAGGGTTCTGTRDAGPGAMRMWTRRGGSEMVGGGAQDDGARGHENKSR